MAYSSKQDSHQHSEGNGQDHGHSINASEAQLPELRPALTAPVSPGFHGNGQFISTAKGTDEQRNQQGDQALGPLHQAAALEIGASSHLRFHDLLRLLQESGNEA